MAKTLVISTYGYRNTGDEAQGLSAIGRLQKAMPDVEISVTRTRELDQDDIPGCTRNPLVYLVVEILEPETSPRVERLYRALGVFGSLLARATPYLRRWRLLLQGWVYGKTGLILSASAKVRRILRTVGECDLLYIAGSGGFNDIWLRAGLVARMVCVRLFGYAGKPVVISGQGVGPLTSRFGRRFLKKSMHHVDLITFRDLEGSQRFLAGLGVPESKMRSVGDDSMGLEPSDRESAAALIREAGLDPSQPILGVTARLTTWHKKEVLGYAGQIAAILDRLIETFRTKVLFVPTEFWPSKGWDDRDHAYHVLRQMRHWREAAVIHPELDPARTKALVGLCRMYLALPYHPCVFALEAGVPVVGLYSGAYHEARLKGLFAFYDLPECAIPYAEATPEKVEGVFGRLLAGPAPFAKRVAEANARIRRDIDVTVWRAAELLGKSAGEKA
jgi:polysaccharide pyruvyl transferase WcaK-like protein